jgi:hypothetical protein
VGLEYRTGTGTDADFDVGDTITATSAACTSGKTVTGGGTTVTGGTGNVFERQSGPGAGNTTWTASLGSTANNQNVTLTVTAICATP